MTRIVTFPALTTAFTLALAAAAFADDEYNVSNSLTLTGHPLGMHGVDPVSMFEAEKPELGNATYTSVHEGVDYYFATQAAQAAFEADPVAHLPQFGGFCAFGVYVGKKLDGDVRYADIVDGKLYLFVNQDIFNKYLENKETVIQGAHAKWADIHHTPVGRL